MRAGASSAGSDALELYRIVRGVPRFGVDLRERDLPQETGQQYALNFAKGCYIGQEIVERIRARGNVHRAFAGFELQGEPPQPGTKVRANDKDVGEDHQRGAGSISERRAYTGAGISAARSRRSRDHGADRRSKRYRRNITFPRLATTRATKSEIYARQREEI